jgi:hypothetical protein
MKTYGGSHELRPPNEIVPLSVVLRSAAGQLADRTLSFASSFTFHF